MSVELHPNQGPGVIVKVSPVIYHEADKAVHYLRQVGAAVVKLESITCWANIMIGRQIKAIIEQRMFKKIERRDYRNPAHPEGIPQWTSEEDRYFRTGTDFLKEGLPMIMNTGIVRGIRNLKLARSKTISSLNDDEIKQFKHIGTLEAIADLEKRDIDMTPRILQQAKMQEPAEFYSAHFKYLPPPEAKEPIDSNGTVIPHRNNRSWVVRHWLDRINKYRMEDVRLAVQDLLEAHGYSPENMTESLLEVFKIMIEQHKKERRAKSRQ